MTEDNHKEANDTDPRRETVSFAFDRMTVARFREVFPNARWSDTLQAWTVPGKTARKRIDRWLASEADRRTPYEEERGRDAFQFEPILSPYLQVYDRGFRIKTPYSRTVVDELRQIPFARWNGDDKVWEVPYASYDDLQHRWEAIEEAAKRAEPEERRKRAEARKGTEEEAKAKRRTSERRKKRVPVPSDDLPPLGRPLSTTAFGIVVITEITGELVDPEEVAEHHPDADDEHAWAGWRAATLDELVHTWPARSEPGEHERLRGWWQPTLEELRVARSSTKSRERRRPVAMPLDSRLDLDRLRDYNCFIGVADALQRVPLAIPRLPALTTDVLAGIGRRTKGRCDFAPAFFVVDPAARGEPFGTC